jgi:group I intron endonuclease
MIVYLATNWVDGKQYVGITRNNLNNRIWHHLNFSTSYFGNALKKYGIQSFEIRVIDSANDWNTLCEKEKAWIKKLDTQYPNGYNLTGGGEGLAEISEFTRKKLSDAAKLRVSPMKGRKHSEASKLKMSKNRTGISSGKGKTVTQETRDKISKSLMGNVPWNKGTRGGERWLQ